MALSMDILRKETIELVRLEGLPFSYDFLGYYFSPGQLPNLICIQLNPNQLVILSSQS